MKKLAIAVVALGLMLLAAPTTNACSTHGYVRASTLNDLFQGVANQDNGIQFEAPWGTQGDVADGYASNLSDPHLDTAHYDDGHAFGWKMKGVNGSNWTTVHTSDGSADQEIDSIIAQIESQLSESYDKNFAN